jgi:hypothetical protein
MIFALAESRGNLGADAGADAGATGWVGATGAVGARVRQVQVR